MGYTFSGKRKARNELIFFAKRRSIMAATKGKGSKVTDGSNTILGMGTWSIDGVTSDQLEDTEFGDAWKTYLYGLNDGGTVSFNGYYDPADTTGQTVLRTANANQTQMTDIRFYVDSTSYWRPNSTGTPSSHIIITAWNISADKSGLMQCTFSGKVSGKMDLV